MIKTEIIGFGQKINRAVKLVELSDTLTQYRRRRHERCNSYRFMTYYLSVQNCFFYLFQP
jgi:hypothetical protein